MVVTSRFLFPRHINIKKIQVKKTFPSFDLGIDHLFPSEPEERKQKKDEQQRSLVI